MSAFDVAEGRLLIALFIAHHAESREILTWRHVEAVYHTNINEMHFEAIVAELSAAGIVKSFRDKDGSAVILVDHGVRQAHDRILAFLDADTFDVNWKAERILTDAPEGTDIPCPSGWMLLHTKKKGMKAQAEPAPRPRASADVQQKASRKSSLAAGAPHRTPNKDSSSESGWVKWQTILTAIGVVLAIVAIVVTIRYS